jgi:hypothetical protein
VIHFTDVELTSHNAFEVNDSTNKNRQTFVDKKMKQRKIGIVRRPVAYLFVVYLTTLFQ